MKQQISRRTRYIHWRIRRLGPKLLPLIKERKVIFPMGDEWTRMVVANYDRIVQNPRPDTWDYILLKYLKDVLRHRRD